MRPRIRTDGSRRETAEELPTFLEEHGTVDSIGGRDVGTARADAVGLEGRSLERTATTETLSDFGGDVLSRGAETTIMTDGPRHRLGELMEQSDPPFREVMSCVFGIENHETRTYLVLIDHPGSTSDELSTVLGRDRSTVNRSLSTLHDRGLVRRDRRLLDGGGYVYQYTAVALEDAKEMLHEALDAWTEQVHEIIDEFDGER